MYSTQDVIQAAKEIKEQLSELLGKDASSVEQSLSKLLLKADSNQQQVDNEILELLASYEPTRIKFTEILRRENKLPDDDTETTRGGFQNPPGTSSPPPSNGKLLYTCPEPDCNFSLEISSVGEPATCPIHDCDLV